jgi:two-component system, chemotaxis family, protein-glutamate methylesterase/glutaminase
MASRDVVVIGASAGGVEALKRLVNGLPPHFPATIFAVLHVAPHSPGYLPEILARAGPLPATHAQDNERFERGRIYVAPPDHHLVVESPGRIRLTRGPRENRSRPAIDPLFRSAALAFGRRVIGVLLSGHLNDGTAGLRAVKIFGGIAIVQSPADAEAPSMPASALRHVQIDHCLPLSEIPSTLARLTRETIATSEDAERSRMSKELEIEVNIAREVKARDAGVGELGEPSIFTCPECHGTLLQLRDQHPLRFRCHTGHAFTADSLLADLSENIESSIWSSIRSIEESAMLLRHMAEHLEELAQGDLVKQFLRRAADAQRRADLMRQAVAVE